jgi:tetratricopeptide (TPR) repeat protein
MNPNAINDAGRAPRPTAWTALACALIVAAGIAAYSNSFNGPFIFDDKPAIQDNSTLRHFPSRENLIPPFANSISRRPVVNFTLALNYALGGLDVRGFHAGNLLIHLLAALALFGIVRRTLLSPTLRDRFGRASTGLATAVTLIWAVHPLQTESVTYLTQRTESLMALLYLLTLYGAIRGASSGHPWRWYAAAIAACALGMGSKEVMATAPIIVLLYDRCFLSGSFREALRRRLPFYLGLAATWAILGALLIAYPWGEASGAGFGLAEAGPWEYARTQPGVILNYLRLSFWPSPLCVDYYWPIATSAGQILPAAAVVAALLAATLWALRRAPSAPSSGAGRSALGFLGAWFFLILAPSSSFVPIVTEVAAERRMYLPLAAIVTACVVAAWRLGRQWIRRVDASPGTQKFLGRAMTAAALSVAGVLGCLTFDRNADYRDAISIWQDTAGKRPWNSRAKFNLGASYLDAGRPDEAIRCFNRAIELKPDFFDAYYNRGLAFAKINRPAEAVRDFNKAIELKPAYADAYNNRAAVAMNTGRYDEALADCDKAIALKPDCAEAYVNRGNIYAVAHRYAEALRDYDQAIALKPDYADAWLNRGTAYGNAGRPEEALRDMDKAIALKPDYAEAYVNRGNMHAVAHRYAEALRDYDQAIALKPDYVDAWLNRGTAYGNAGRPEEALRDLDKAIALNPDYAPAYLHRGNIHMAAKRCAEAIGDYTRAIEINPGYAAAYLNRAIAYYTVKDYPRALSDARAAQRLGGRPPPDLLRALDEAAGRSEPPLSPAP